MDKAYKISKHNNYAFINCFTILQNKQDHKIINIRNNFHCKCICSGCYGTISDMSTTRALVFEVNSDRVMKYYESMLRFR